MSKDQAKEQIAETKAHVKGVASKPLGIETMKQQNKVEKDAGKGRSSDRDPKGGSKKRI